MNTLAEVTATINITPVIEAVIGLVAALISAFIIPYIRKKSSTQDRQEMLQWVEIAVSAAQQLLHTEDGEARKKYVQDFLKEKGYDIDTTEIDSAIEAAVLKLHQELKQPDVKLELPESTK